ncbi:hypothetical protein ACFC18_49585 [Streptomyces sp. NPDC056121]|uniref:hypothetical protein n=1 Tax=unclassified Streptomyces TaxID=2593676 RepID=UPI0035E2D639
MKSAHHIWSWSRSIGDSKAGALARSTTGAASGDTGRGGNGGKATSDNKATNGNTGSSGNSGATDGNKASHINILTGGERGHRGGRDNCWGHHQLGHHGTWGQSGGSSWGHGQHRGWKHDSDKATATSAKSGRTGDTGMSGNAHAWGMGHAMGRMPDPAVRPQRWGPEGHASSRPTAVGVPAALQ